LGVGKTLMEKSGLASRWKQVLFQTSEILKSELRLSLIQMILLTHLKAGFEKKELTPVAS
jgi:hypothetical protein